MVSNRQHVGMVFAEMVGTFILTMVATSASGLGIPLFTGAAVGFCLAAMVMILGGLSGAHLNPAVTVGLLSIRKISIVKAASYVVAQMLGGLAAWKVTEYFAGRTILSQVSAFDWNKDKKIFFAEILGSMIFGFGIASAVYQKFADTKAAATIGTSLFLGVIVASIGSAAILNPAVAYGVRNFNVGYAGAPVLGMILGMNIYAFFFVEGWNPVKTNKSVKKTK
jgi:glycerol uptake facilitator-like aquaporin